VEGPMLMVIDRQPGFLCTNQLMEKYFFVVGTG